MKLRVITFQAIFFLVVGGIILFSLTSKGWCAEHYTENQDSVRMVIEKESKMVWKQSLLVPGWGQTTNGGWWWVKVPIIYGGYVSGILAHNYNNKYYKYYLSEAQYRSVNNHAAPPNSIFQEGNSQLTQAFINAKDNSRRNRDLSILFLIGWHVLNGIEAYVDHMLKNRWDVRYDLSFSVGPEPYQSPLAFNYPNPISFKMAIRF